MTGTCRSRSEMFVIIACFLLTVAPWTRAAHENDMCDNVAACIPPEPTGNAAEICSIFLKSVTCMEEAVDACRRIPNFSQELLDESEALIMELRSELGKLSCLDDKLRKDQRAAATAAATAAAKSTYRSGLKRSKLVPAPTPAPPPEVRSIATPTATAAPARTPAPPPPEVIQLEDDDDDTLSEPMQYATPDYERETEKNNAACSRTGHARLVFISPASAILAAYVYLLQFK